MDEDLQICYNCLKAAEKNKNYGDIYMFLKDCAFKRMMNIVSQKSYPQNVTNQLANLYNQFQQEIQQFKWNFNSMKKERYSNFLNYYYKQYNFDTCSVEDLTTLKILTENFQYLGPVDNLTIDRGNIFN